MLLGNQTGPDIQQTETSQTPEQSAETLFQEKGCYADFLRNLGVREVNDGALYRLAPQEGEHWMPRMDDVAEAVQQLPVQENVPFEEALSVLSFVVEKLDKSKPVPQQVRSSMCRDVLKQAVMQRFKEATGEIYANLTELSHKISDNMAEANETFNTIRIYDPSMGSGLFLTTMLNEIIALKSRLGILADKQGNPLFQYKIQIDGDDLLVFDKKRFSAHSFSDSDPESKRIREALLHEKRILIEQCLFGADINPTSVSIGRVRLWLELLKHFRWETKQAVLPLVTCNLRWLNDDTNKQEKNPVFEQAGEWCYEIPKLLDGNGDFQEANITTYLAQNATHPVVDKEEGTPSGSAVFSILSDTEKQLINKLKKAGMPLDAWDIRMYSGIKTGCDAAFVIDGKAKDEFIQADYKNVDIIKPLLMGENIRRYVPEKSDHWLLCIPWHFPLLYDKTITAASERAELRFQQQYPFVYEHLTKYKNELISRDSEEIGITFEWYALQNAGTGLGDDFAQQKIVWQREAAASNFCLDYSGCFILDTTCFATGQHLRYLLGILNSKLGRYMLRDAPGLSNGNRQFSIQTLESLKIPIPNIKIESEVTSLVSKRASESQSIDSDEVDRKIDRLVYDIYQLNDKEREFVETTILYSL